MQSTTGCALYTGQQIKSVVNMTNGTLSSWIPGSQQKRKGTEFLSGCSAKDGGTNNALFSSGPQPGQLAPAGFARGSSQATT